MTNLKSYTVHTGMGQHQSGLEDVLSEEELKEFSNVGCSGKSSCSRYVTYEQYLNSLGKGEFSVKQTKHDSGDFQESFEISHAIEEKEVKPKSVGHGVKCTIDDDRSVTAWNLDDGCTGFIFLNKEHRTPLWISDEAIEAMLAVWLETKAMR